ncbi:MAG: UvrD-helicase domain-containing protein, partial [Coriobacteriales bacterium]
VDLKLRRQFDIDGRVLNAYFDTTVAIQDELLLESLAKQRSAHLTAITTTIQKEQNTVIRHEDVPVLLVHGIAGSGKTSVLLQRIAYLFYRKRDELDPEDVCLITPNPVFKRYISDVLPEMGETNPTSTTWDELMDELGIVSRGIGKDVTADDLRAIENAVPELSLDKGDFNDIRVDDEIVITAAQAMSAFDKFRRFPAGTHRSALAVDDLLERLEQRVKRLAASDKAQGMVTDLDVDTQLKVFGSVIDFSDSSEDELKSYTETYLRWRYQGLEERIEDGAWLNIDRIGMRMTGNETLSSVEWLYLKLCLVGGARRNIRYVVIDEVQDYTAAQLMVLDRLFPNAHFLMLGDENQAIREETATFAEIRDLFGRTRKTVEECALMTSYRSSPEITALFKKLLPPEERLEAQSVQRPGTDPEIIEAEDSAAFEEALLTAVDEARDAGCLAAVIAPNKQRMNQLAKLLDGRVTVLSGADATLPDSGVALLSVRLAKGLEFDRVIVTDADNASYPTTTVARHRLYTAISRATKQVTLIANGKLTALLD